MSIFSELLPKLNNISKDYVNNFNDELKAALQSFRKFEEEFQNGKSRAREKISKDKNLMTTLQSIHEDEDEAAKPTEADIQASADEARSSSDSNSERRGSKKRGKNEVDGILSPEQDKRQKRNASVKAQSIISKQVNVNLNQKMRREDPADKSTNRRRPKDDDKENTEPIQLVQVKQEKISLPPEPMEMESLNIEVKQEANTDEIAMPPPFAPVPKPRKALQKEKEKEKAEESTDDESSGSGNRRRTTRTRKQTDTMPPPTARASRSTRASSRATRQEAEESAPEARPKRTRAKKKAESESSNADTEKEIQAPQENGIGSPAEKPRPKRTRRAQKAAEKEESSQESTKASPPIEPQEPKESEKPVAPVEKPVVPSEKPVVSTEKPVVPVEKPVAPTKPEKAVVPTEPILLSPKKERISEPDVAPSPIIKQAKITKNMKKDKVDGAHSKIDLMADNTKTILIESSRNIALEETRIIAKESNVNGDMDKTVVLPNGVYAHAPVTPKAVRNMNETVVLETCNRETMVLDKPKPAIMDATVVIEKDTKASDRLTDDNSLLTNDSDSQECNTPPKPPPVHQPTSAVKEKVQQFEELASRVTRTKTRAMAKKEEPQNENQTPPDKMLKPAFSADTLNKMNNMIFNGKAPQVSTSASKPSTNISSQVRSFLPTSASASKLSGVQRARETADREREKEDARKKKEALLEAKREMQKRKREEKMAAAAAARELAARERHSAMLAAAKGRMEKQAHADLGKLEKLKEVERKKQELARKVAETEERRRAEELARQQRLAEEQRRAEALRKKQIEEAEAMKKEEAIMAREIEKRKKEYIEKQKLKQRLEGNKIQTPLKRGQFPPIEPVYMEDGFQYLTSDEEAEHVEMPVPLWSTSKARRAQLYIQARVKTELIDRLFSVREHTPDLREIFPMIERARLKRTSSAVWRTPPRLDTLQE